MAISGTLNFVCTLTAFETPDGTVYDIAASEKGEAERLYKLFLAVARTYPANEVNIQIVFEDKASSKFRQGDLVIQIDGGGKFKKSPPQSDSEWKAWFKNILDSKGAKGSDPSEVTGNSTGGFFFGLDENGYAFNRECGWFDTMLNALGLGKEIKRGIFAVGTVFFAYNALNSRNNLMMAANAGVAGGFGYLFFGKEDCPFEIPTLEKNGKTIALGAGASIGLLALYQFYLKPRAQERRLTRIVRAATQKPEAKTKAAMTSGRRRATKVKSVTTTKRY